MRIGIPTAAALVMAASSISANGQSCIYGGLVNNTPAGDTGRWGAVIESDSEFLIAASTVVGVKIYESTGTGIVFDSNLIAIGVLPNDLYGFRADIGGGHAVVGAPWTDGPGPMEMKAGKAYVFKQNKSGVWIEDAKLVVPGYGDSSNRNNDYLGIGLAVGDRWIAVAATGQLPEGVVHLYDTTNNYNHVTSVKPVMSSLPNFFGIEIALHEEYMAVGAHGESINSGAVYLYGQDVGGVDNWGFIKKFVSPNPESGGQFGSALDFDGAMLLVGANNENNSDGRVYTYAVNAGGAGNWGFVEEINPPANIKPFGLTGVNFGIHIKAGGGIALISATSGDLATNPSLFTRGVVTTYGREGSFWNDTNDYIEADAAGGPQSFGSAFAISNGNIMVGAVNHSPLDGGATFIGSADCESGCQADLNGDSEVDSDDFAILLAEWGMTGSGDLDGDGAVGSSDVAILIAAWGVCS